MTNVGTDPRARAHDAAPRPVEPEVAEELARIDRAQWNVIADPETGEERQAKRADVTHSLPRQLAAEVLPLVPPTLPAGQAFQRLELLRKALADAAEGTRVVNETPAKRAALAGELAQLRTEREAERAKVEGWEPSDGDPPSHVPLQRWDRLIRENRAADRALVETERVWTMGPMSGLGKLDRATEALPELIANATSKAWWDGVAQAHDGTFRRWEAAATRNAQDDGRRRVEERRRREADAAAAAQADAQEAARRHVRDLAATVTAG
ncbi:hypothetical protein [Litorihabitans aurantiacus]|uniref:Uncharacterized protein n=1 Tax=Litorihabitans aurantiacus TaxID=1930061 RepID=A0AA38CU92_9MICO|nr:hypothetical protein [Litorihabitans aurantiacus]GMA32574.1 hypothetical protein GCM10025875_25660 [Litorihabitans aurantiacus]